MQRFQWPHWENRLGTSDDTPVGPVPFWKRAALVVGGVVPEKPLLLDNPRAGYRVLVDFRRCNFVGVSTYK